MPNCQCPRCLGGSKSFSLSLVDLKKLGKGMLIAISGAALTYLSEWRGDVDFGIFKPAIVAGLSVLVAAFQKYIVDTTPEETDAPAEP